MFSCTNTTITRCVGINLEHSLSFVASDSQTFEEQQRLVANILKQKESEFEAVNDEKLLLEKEYEKLELELKKVTNEKFDCQDFNLLL